MYSIAMHVVCLCVNLSCGPMQLLYSSVNPVADSANDAVCMAWHESLCVAVAGWLLLEM